jgi:hypothetical protein
VDDVDPAGGHGRSDAQSWPADWAEAVDRPKYQLFNLLKIDAAAPKFGPIALVMNRSTTKDSVFLTPLDSGFYTIDCNRESECGSAAASTGCLCTPAHLRCCGLCLISSLYLHLHCMIGRRDIQSARPLPSYARRPAEYGLHRLGKIIQCRCLSPRYKPETINLPRQA